MDQPSPVISQQVFGSSKKIQFIGIPAHDTKLAGRGPSGASARLSSVQQTMSIESLLDSNGDTSYTRPAPIMSTRVLPEPYLPKRRWTSIADERSTKQPRCTNHTTSSLPLVVHKDNMTTITCLHASVAQKSYGSEKRFLCPPPLVMMRSKHRSGRPRLSMAVVGDMGDLSQEQQGILDEQLCTSFKYLHVAGTAKAKQFSLRVSLSALDNQTTAASHTAAKPYVTLLSNPITIISKPSKKTLKARNVESCILANTPISLFNRINSQTVRTKYMTSEGNRLCAKNTTWSAFDIIITRSPGQPGLHDAHIVHHTSDPSPVPVLYGTEIILKDSQTGATSLPLIIRKVDRGRIIPCVNGPVSQMQKIALQLASSVHNQPVYLSAASSLTEASSEHHEGCLTSTWLDFSRSRIVQENSPANNDSYEQVDDFLCWTIVGISKFECTFFKETLTTAPPTHTSALATQFPILSAVRYYPLSHTLDVIGQHLVLVPGTSQLLDCYLGTYGPLTTRLASVQPEQVGSSRESFHITIELPRTHDLLVANHDNIVELPDTRRRLELPLLFSRNNGIVFHSGKALMCDLNVHSETAHWSLVSVCHHHGK